MHPLAYNGQLKMDSGQGQALLFSVYPIQLNLLTATTRMH